MRFMIDLKKGWFLKNKKDVLNSAWYLQHFDAAPFFLLLIDVTETAVERRKMAGGEFTKRVVWFKDKTADWYISQDDINRISELIFRKSFKLKKINNQKIIKNLDMMQKTNKLISVNLPELIDGKWYHQQGDACLFLIQTLGEPYMLKEKRKHDLFYKHLFLFFQDKIGNWYHDAEDLKFISNDVIKKSDGGAISKSLMKKWKADEGGFLIKAKQLDKINLAKLSNSQLKELFTDYIKTYFKAVSSSSLIDGFALGTDEIIQKEINTFLKDKNLSEAQHRYFTILTAPVNQSFINEAEVSLLKLAQIVKDNKQLNNILASSLNEALKEIEKYPKIKKALSSHANNYFWIKNNYYSAPVLTEKDFLEEIRGILSGKVDIQKEINRILNIPKLHREEKTKLIKKLDLPKYLRILLTISEDFTHWQDERKKRTFLMDHYGTIFLEEFGRRFNLEVEDLKYFIYQEILTLFDKKTVVSKPEAARRRQGCLYYQRGQKYEILSNGEALKIKKELFDRKQQGMVDDFRGLPASRGRIRGKVKIVLSVNELNKVKKGDILVAVMTRPDYIPAMKRAAAIITDEGGVTCHAAIVSRELGIPCIIGTKLATRVLKDGDEVDVNANHGVVTVIKRK